MEDGLGMGRFDARGIADSAGRLWFATLVRRVPHRRRVTLYGREAAYNDFTVVGRRMASWFGTRVGAVARRTGSPGRRWLPRDDIRDIAVDALGNAWFATP